MVWFSFIALAVLAAFATVIWTHPYMWTVLAWVHIPYTRYQWIGLGALMAGVGFVIGSCSRRRSHNITGIVSIISIVLIIARILVTVYLCGSSLWYYGSMWPAPAAVSGSSAAIARQQDAISMVAENFADWDELPGGLLNSVVVVGGGAAAAEDGGVITTPTTSSAGEEVIGYDEDEVGGEYEMKTPFFAGVITGVMILMVVSIAIGGVMRCIFTPRSSPSVPSRRSRRRSKLPLTNTTRTEPPRHIEAYIKQRNHRLHNQKSEQRHQLRKRQAGLKSRNNKH